MRIVTGGLIALVSVAHADPEADASFGPRILVYDEGAPDDPPLCRYWNGVTVNGC